jgi:hypothetical protein
MDETRSRRVSLANEIATWSAELPALLAKILVAAKRADLPGRQKLDLEITARRINTLFNAIGVTPDAGADDDALLEELIQNTDRLRELITSAKGTVDAISKLPSSADPQSAAGGGREWRSSFVNRIKR